MKKIVCVGHASFDITFPLDSYPAENTKNRVPDKVGCGGGPASNAAYLLGRWGMDTTFVGVVGNDIYGKKVLNEFRNVSVKIDHVEIDPDHETTLSFIVVNKQNGSRTTFTYRDEEMKYKKNLTIPADVILVDGQELEASSRIIKANPNAITILDAGTCKDATIQLGKIVKYLVCSRNFAEDFTNIKVNLNDRNSIVDIYHKMEETFKNNIIITLEDKGCLYKENEKIKLMPSIKVKAVDSTGAGDFFHGAFAYCIANDFDLEKSLKVSNITGALSVTRMGGRYSVYSLEEVMQIYAQNI